MVEELWFNQNIGKAQVLKVCDAISSLACALFLSDYEDKILFFYLLGVIT